MLRSALDADQRGVVHREAPKHIGARRRLGIGRVWDIQAAPGRGVNLWVKNEFRMTLRGSQKSPLTTHISTGCRCLLHFTRFHFTSDTHIPQGRGSPASDSSRASFYASLIVRAQKLMLNQSLPPHRNRALHLPRTEERGGEIDIKSYAGID